MSVGCYLTFGRGPCSLKALLLSLYVGRVTQKTLNIFCAKLGGWMDLGHNLLNLSANLIKRVPQKFEYCRLGHLKMTEVTGYAVPFKFCMKIRIEGEKTPIFFFIFIFNCIVRQI